MSQQPITSGLTQLACLATLLEHMDIKGADVLSIDRAQELLEFIRFHVQGQITDQNNELLDKEDA